MEMNTLLLWVACSFMMVSCSSKNITGVYAKRTPFFSTIIELKPDSTFVLVQQGDLTNSKRIGLWAIRNDTVILNSPSYRFNEFVADSKMNYPAASCEVSGYSNSLS